MARIAFVGSRDFDNPDAVRELVEAEVAKLPPGTVVVSGGARGVDSWAEDEARRRGLEVSIFKPDWEKYGRKAGPLRNKLIVEDCDELIAFWDGVSRGTASSIQFAREAGKPVRIIYEPTP